MTSYNLYLKTLALGACAILASCSGLQTTPAAVTQSSDAVNASKNDDALAVVHNFDAGQADGSHPMGDLVAVDGTLYGTTSDGGANKQGAVYAVNRDGTERVVYSFKGGSDGQFPYGGLVNLNGTLYGTTTLGGSSYCGGPGYAEGCGVVFSVSPAGRETVIHIFDKSGSEGEHPWAALTVVDGVLYGNTFQGGAHNAGTVFSITSAGTLKKIHDFNGNPDGGSPVSAMTDVGGILYGTTEFGGGNGCFFKSGCGTIFTIATSGDEKVLHTFTGGSDGSWPMAKLLNEGGVLYGSTTSGGGPKGCGTIFSVTTGGNQRTLHTFAGTSGCSVSSRLTYTNGMFYGASAWGGSTNNGTIFSMTSSGKVRSLYSFEGGAKGLYPESALIALDGKLFGTTYDGGTGRGCGSSSCGFVYTFAP
jgi:uncharacterized repeat protein (TIGR03803 family)